MPARGGDDAGMTRAHSRRPEPKSEPQPYGFLETRARAAAKAANSGSSAQVGTSTGNLTSVENDSSVPDPVFSYPDPSNPNAVINTRRTTGRNTPSVVNAVFNYRNFWDGRAQNECNGANPFGQRDKNSHLMVVKDDGTLSPVLVSMKNSALCSQSLGPILSSTEMSADGRDFKQVGHKLLARKPLAKQMVDPTDSVLGLISNSPSTGINTTYAAMIQKAFLPEWYSFAKHVCFNADGSTAATLILQPLPARPAQPNTRKWKSTSRCSGELPSRCMRAR